MKFKTLAAENFFKSPGLHPDARSAAVDFDHWSTQQGLPEALVADVQRSKVQLTDIYFGRYKDLRALAVIGSIDRLSIEDQELAKICRSLTDTQLLAKAEDRFSWHCVGCGIDFSGNPYSTVRPEKNKPSQTERVHAYFEKLYEKPKWEYLRHVVVGDKPHFHLGRRDYDWKEKYKLTSPGVINGTA